MRGDIPLELEESALVDGCTRFAVLRKVVFPMARAGLFATAVFTFVFAWNDFIFALVLTRREVTTFPVQVTHYFGGQSNFWAKIAAMSCSARSRSSSRSRCCNATWSAGFRWVPSRGSACACWRHINEKSF